MNRTIEHKGAKLTVTPDKLALVGRKGDLSWRCVFERVSLGEHFCVFLDTLFGGSFPHGWVGFGTYEDLEELVTFLDRCFGSSRDPVELAEWLIAGAFHSTPGHRISDICGLETWEGVQEALDEHGVGHHYELVRRAVENSHDEVGLKRAVKVLGESLATSG